LDVCEIGSRVHERGSVIHVKALGALGLIDEGEADWKILAIDVTDPMADKLNDLNDVEAHMPGLLDATRDWFRIYKVPTGKPANKFAADGKWFDRAFALKTIDHDHGSWSSLLKGSYTTDTVKNISTINTTQATHKVSGDEAHKIMEESSQVHNASPASVDQVAIDAVHYVDRSKL
jgi:hypothetical protein